jgi:hypothetical protein
MIKFNSGKNKNMRKSISIIMSFFIISSCTEDENLAQEPVNRTIIVYMAADNGLIV